MIFVFGAVLIFTAARLAFQGEHEIHPEKNPLIRLLRRFVPMTDNYVGDKLFTRQGAVLAATPLLAVLVMVGSTDLVFALDSIPAIFGLTNEAYIVFMANAFALMGLRQLYFVLDGMRDRLVYLTQGLALVLGFIGVKLVITALYSGDWIDFHISTYASLAFIVVVLAITVIASLIKGPKVATPGESDLAGHHRHEGAGLDDIAHEKERLHLLDEGD